MQLWRPVTIRGYTFNVGDNVTLDQTKVEKTPAVGGDFAWLFAAYQAERTGTPFESFWNRLPPPLLREGNKVQTPWLTSFLQDPHMIRPAAQLRMPRFHYGKSDDESPSRRPTSWPIISPRGTGPSSPTRSIPEQNAQLSCRAEQGPSRLPGRRLDDDDEQGVALPPVPRDRPVQAQRRRRRSSTGPTCARSRRGSGRTTWRRGSPTRGGCVPFTAMPQNIAPHGTIQILVPKTFENKPIEMVRAIRDTLLNYVNAVELQLASSRPRRGGRRPGHASQDYRRNAP